MADKAQQMAAIKAEIEALAESPLYEYRTTNRYQVVIGEGNPDASILFIGEAPGKQEAKSGRPFVGASGKMLDKLLEHIGLARGDVYITNVVKDRPPENRDPTKEEVELYTPFLTRQIDIIRPKVIATLGRFAMDYVFGLFDMAEQGEKISAMHGQALKGQAAYGPVAVVPLYHPAVALYNAGQRDTLFEDFEALKAFI